MVKVVDTLVCEYVNNPVRLSLKSAVQKWRASILKIYEAH